MQELGAKSIYSQHSGVVEVSSRPVQRLMCAEVATAAACCLAACCHASVSIHRLPCLSSGQLLYTYCC